MQPDSSRKVPTTARPPATARQLIKFFTLGGRSRPDHERAQRLLIDLGVSADAIPSFGEYLCGTQEAEAALRSR